MIMRLKKLNSKAFTLIEILVVLPIISIILLGMSGFLFSQYTQMVAESMKAQLLLEGEVLLYNIQDELLFTTGYEEELISQLSDPNEPSGGWDFDTSPNETLIISETALTSDRRDPDREFVYRNFYGCSSSYNPIAFNNLIYFTEDNPDNNYSSFYRRTVIGTYSTCGTNYKDFTCPEAQVGTGPCTKKDSQLSERVKSFTIDYYDDNNVVIDTSTTSPTLAEKVTVNLTLGDEIFGQEFEAKAKVTMKKIN